jgi:hypothetical protein
MEARGSVNAFLQKAVRSSRGECLRHTKTPLFFFHQKNILDGAADFLNLED